MYNYIYSPIKFKWNDFKCAISSETLFHIRIPFISFCLFRMMLLISRNKYLQYKHLVRISRINQTLFEFVCAIELARIMY